MSRPKRASSEPPPDPKQRRFHLLDDAGGGGGAAISAMQDTAPMPPSFCIHTALEAIPAPVFLELFGREGGARMMIQYLEDRWIRSPDRVGFYLRLVPRDARDFLWRMAVTIGSVPCLRALTTHFDITMHQITDLMDVAVQNYKPKCDPDLFMSALIGDCRGALLSEDVPQAIWLLCDDGYPVAATTLLHKSLGSARTADQVAVSMINPVWKDCLGAEKISFLQAAVKTAMSGCCDAYAWLLENGLTRHVRIAELTLCPPIATPVVSPMTLTMLIDTMILHDYPRWPANIWRTSTGTGPTKDNIRRLVSMLVLTMEHDLLDTDAMGRLHDICSTNFTTLQWKYFTEAIAVSMAAQKFDRKMIELRDRCQRSSAH